eukprot:GHVS01021590.1.p1 GENE.GHVS01021590.1~~GHVS01021590.1.p1  ORF type:complete len:127 (+),score=12.54 GHVS01021590.1:354-734(+)
MGCACTSPAVYDPLAYGQQTSGGSWGQRQSYPSTGKRKVSGTHGGGRGHTLGNGNAVGGTQGNPEDTAEMRMIRAEAAEKRQQASATRGGVSAQRMEMIKRKEKQELEELKKGKPSHTDDILRMFD